MEVWRPFLIVALALVAGCASNASAIRTATQESTDAGRHDEWLDGGSDIGATTAWLRQLAVDYNCPAAEPAIDFPDGGRFESAARVARTDCIEVRAAAEVHKWRDLADAGAFQAQAAPPTAVDWGAFAAAAVSALAAIVQLLKK